MYLSHVSSPVSQVSGGTKVSKVSCSSKVSQVSTPIYFKGADHILSNLYSCTLIYQGVTFASSEHLYQYRKAVEHFDFYLAKLILEAQTAKESKSISKHIKTSQQWFYS